MVGFRFMFVTGLVVIAVVAVDARNLRAVLSVVLVFVSC